MPPSPEGTSFQACLEGSAASSAQDRRAGGSIFAVWRWLTALGALAVLGGALPVADALAVLGRIAPILAFLVGITVLAELADAAGTFGVAASVAARWGRGRVWGLFLLIAVLATGCTVTLSLDTTAVLLTPVVLTLASSVQLPSAPFAVLTLWLANTASLLLPVSNLTNLLAAREFARWQVSFLRLMLAPAVAVLVVTLLVVGLRYRRQLRGRYALPPPVHVPDPWLLTTASLICLAVGPLFALGANVAVVACGAAALLVLAFGIRAPQCLTLKLLPWRLVFATVGLFLLVQTVLHLGADRLVTASAGTGTGGWALLRLAGTAAAASNVVNNLPAYLALEPRADGVARRLAAVLVGTNAGALVLPWGSLATLLWRERCAARGMRISAVQLAGLGLIAVPLLLLAGVGAIWVAPG